MKRAIIIIGIVSLLLAAIGIVLWYLLGSPDAPSDDLQPDTSTEVNPFIKRIENEIDSLSKMPVNVFSTDLYYVIQYHIDDGYQNNSFGISENDNSAWKNILSEKLYYTYVQKFIRQAFSYFRRSEWIYPNLIIIRDEILALQKSAYLETGSIASKELDDILNVIKKYEEINNFIQKVNKYLLTGAFNLSSSKSYLVTIQQYLLNNLGNEYVRNCRHFYISFDQLREKIYIKHWNHVVGLFNTSLNKYRTDNYAGDSWAQKASEYRNKVYDPVLEEIERFEVEMENTYRIKRNDMNVNSLKSRWKQEFNDAMDYFKTNY